MKYNDDIEIKKKTVTRRQEGKFLLQFCDISLQRLAIVGDVTIVNIKLLILLSLFVVVYPCLPYKSDF